MKINGGICSRSLLCVFHRGIHGRYRGQIFAYALQGQAIMKLKWVPEIVALCFCFIFCSDVPLRCWRRIRRRKARRRRRTGLPLAVVMGQRREYIFQRPLSLRRHSNATALRLPLQLTLQRSAWRLVTKRPPITGFPVFAQGEAVIVTGPADYSVPTLSLHKIVRICPDHLDPREPGAQPGLPEMDAR